MTIQQPILLVGYTARMLAELAIRAGYRVTALDFFGDSDLRALAPSLSLLRNFDGKAYSPQALAAAARRIDAGAVVYGASFENHPKLVAELASGRQLLGNTPETLARVRDPFALFDALRAAGFATPRTRAAGALMDGRWLWKPARGGGGSGVRWPDGTAPSEGIAQEFVEGLACSFTFVANGSEAALIGLSEQLIGLDAFGSGGFRWCGNLVPPRAPVADIDAMLAEAGRIAAHLTGHFALRGLNTVDFIWCTGRIWTLEVNARPSASAELFERVLDVRLFDAHVRGAMGEAIGTYAHTSMSQRAAGKTVLFARADTRVGDTGGWLAQGLRDIPHSGEAIAKGHPVCTLLAEGETPDAVFDLLLAKAGRVESWLRTPHDPEISSL